MMPGQVVNILEVPIEIVELPARCCSSSNIEGSLSNWQQLQTLDPATKYEMLEPPPASKTHARSFSDGTLKGRLEHHRLSVLEETVSQPATPALHCAEAMSVQRKDSHNVSSCNSSIYSQDSSCSAAALTSEDLEEGPSGFTRPVAEQGLYQLPEVSESSLPGAVDLHGPDAEPVEQVEHADISPAEISSASPKVKASFPIRKLSALSIGPFSVQNVQFYNESRPGTMLNEDPEQHRPRVYSLPTSELRSSEEGSLQLSPMTAPEQRPSTTESEEGYFALDSDIADNDMGSPSFSMASASSDGEESPLRLSPQNSIKIETRSPSRSGRGFAGFANRIRSMRHRQSRPQTQAEGPPRLTLPSFINYELPPAMDSNHSLAKSHSNFSNHTRSAHGNMPAPTVFDADIPVPALPSREAEGSMADAIFSELGYLSGSIG